MPGRVDATDAHHVARGVRRQREAHRLAQRVLGGLERSEQPVGERVARCEEDDVAIGEVEWIGRQRLRDLGAVARIRDADRLFVRAGRRRRRRDRDHVAPVRAQRREQVAVRERLHDDELACGEAAVCQERQQVDVVLDADGRGPGRRDAGNVADRRRHVELRTSVVARLAADGGERALVARPAAAGERVRRRRAPRRRR